MTTVDPMGFLQRFPPLQNLMTDASIEAAVHSCNPKALYKALRRWCHREQGSPYRASIQELLKRRRFFVSSGDSPSLFTFNGIGTKLYGQSEVEPDGTYIATLFIVFVFIPIFPLAQYLVRDAGPASYQVFGSVPKSNTARIWQWLVLSGIAGAITLGIGNEVVSSRIADVQIVNGLDAPVVVSINGAELEVKPQSRLEQHVKVGPANISARLGKRKIEELNVQVPPRVDVVAYNVLGAAPLYAEGIVYSTQKTSAQNPTVIYAGESFVVRGNVPYVFQKPPGSIQLSSNASSETRWIVDMAPGGWRTSLAMLDQDKRERAEELAVKIGITDPDDRSLEYFIYDLLRSHGTSALMEYGRKLVENNPESIEAHRFYQNYLKLGGKAREAITIYGKMRDSNPGSPMAQYLYARAMPFRESGKLFAELVVRYPDDPYIVRGYSWWQYQSRNYAAALTAFEKLAKFDRKHQWILLQDYASALVALGHADDAAQAVARMAKDQSPEEAFTHALLYARVAKLAGYRAPHSPDHFCKILAKEDPSLPVLLAVYTGERPSDKQLAEIKNEGVRSYLLFIAAIETDPAAAVILAQKIHDRQLRRLEPSRGILLTGELLRLGKKDEADRVLQACDLGVIPGDAVRNYILTGEFAEELHEINLDWQAAGHFCRARLLESRGKSGQDLYRMAEEMDLLKGVVTHAVRNWPRPRPITGIGIEPR